MAFAEVWLNIAQIFCVDVTLWIGADNYSFVLKTPAIYVFVTANQIFFLFRYYLLILIVIHRGIFIVSPKISHYVEAHVTSFILGCWLYVIFINTAYFPLGCIRYYAPETHQWVTECRDDRLLFLRLLRNISGFFFDYIPHFTIGVNVVIILYLNYYRITRKVLMYNRKQTAKFEYTMIFQPLMLACVLAIEPICFFLSNMANKLVSIPPSPEDLLRILAYAMTYLSTLTNFIYYFVCHRDIRSLLWNLVRKKSNDFQVRTISRTVTTEAITRIN